MKIEFHPDFRKAYKKRIENNKKLIKKVNERIELFKKDRQDPQLKDHQLTGSKRYYRSFSITGDIRIVYFEKDQDTAIFYDIGSHNQVY